MTSKSLFFNLMREDAKRRVWTIALTFLAFFFSFPVYTALKISNDQKLRADGYLGSAILKLTDYFSFQNPWTAMLFIFLSLLMGVTSFSYLHSRQKVDFYHGIPVSRSKLFWSNYANGILIPGVLYAVNLAAAMLLLLVSGMGDPALMGTMAWGFILFFIHYSMIYSVTVLSMVLTGNILIGILGTGVFHFFFPCVIFLLELCFTVFFRTNYRGGSRILEFWMDKCSAFTLFIFNMLAADAAAAPVAWTARITAVLAVTVILAFLSLWLYKKRGSEAAGKAMAFRISRPAIRIPIVLCASLYGSLFFWEIRKQMGWAVFGLLCGMFLSHCVIEIIYHFDFGRLFSNWPQMVICAAVSMAVFCCFKYDLFGYDRYIPSEDELESVAISDSATSWVTYGNAEKDMAGNYNWNYIGTDEYIFDHMEVKDMAPVLSLVRTAVRRNQSLYHNGGEEWEDQENHYYFSVKYNLKNGREICRSYTITDNGLSPEFEQLFKDQDYIQAVYPVLTQTPEDTARVKVGMGERNITASRNKNGTDKAMTEKLLVTYQEELKNLTPETMKLENPVAIIQFMSGIQAEAEEKREELKSSWRYSGVSDRGYYPVYPSFKNTISLLKECQVDVLNWNKVERAVKEITIDKNQFERERYGEEWEEGYLSTTDPAEIEQILETAVKEDYSDYNPFNAEDPVILNAVTEEGSSIQCSISIAKLPADIQREIEKIEEDAS